MSEAAPAKRVAIVQSSYIPWKGYFDLINLVDEFLLYDDRQYTRRDWRSRNRIKTAHGVKWLTIPILVRGRYTQRIDQALIEDSGWARRHWTSIRNAYGRAPAFEEHEARFASLYQEVAGLDRLSLVNRRLIEEICEVLDIRTVIRWSTDYEAHGSKTERIIDLCRATAASTYLSGPTGRAYLEEHLFDEAGIRVEYMDYGGYREYPQLYPPFEHTVSVLDLIFNTGSLAAEYLKSPGLG